MNIYSRKKMSGMTLIEMMITISILGILSAIAIPNMMDWVRDARLASQSDLLVTGLSSARLEAVKRRSDVVFCPANDANTATACSGTAADWSKGWLIMTGTEIIQRFVVQKGITISPTVAGAAITSTTFNATLGSSQAAGLVNFSACITGRKGHSVAIYQSGHISKSITSTTCS